MLRFRGLVVVLIAAFRVACGEDTSGGGGGGGGAGAGEGGASSSSSSSSSSSQASSTTVASTSTGECIHTMPVCIGDDDCCPGYSCQFDEEGEEDLCMPR